MKKLFAIGLTFIYLVLSVGVGFNVHYCGGKVKSIDVLFTESKCCCPATEMDNSCCGDEVYFFQLDDDQFFNKTSIADFDLQEKLLPLPTVQTVERTAEALQLRPELYDLPPPFEEDIYLRFGKLIYYG